VAKAVKNLICTIAALVGFVAGFALIPFVMVPVWVKMYPHDGQIGLTALMVSPICGLLFAFLAGTVSALICDRLSRTPESQSTASTPGLR
jgi:hypothetical protein